MKSLFLLLWPTIMPLIAMNMENTPIKLYIPKHTKKIKPHYPLAIIEAKEAISFTGASYNLLLINQENNQCLPAHEFIECPIDLYNHAQALTIEEYYCLLGKIYARIN